MGIGTICHVCFFSKPLGGVVPFSVSSCSGVSLHLKVEGDVKRGKEQSQRHVLGNKIRLEGIGNNV